MDYDAMVKLVSMGQIQVLSQVERFLELHRDEELMLRVQNLLEFIKALKDTIK